MTLVLTHQDKSSYIKQRENNYSGKKVKLNKNKNSDNVIPQKLKSQNKLKSAKQFRVQGLRGQLWPVDRTTGRRQTVIDNI